MGLQESGVRLVADGAQAFENQIERASRAVNEFGDRAGGASRGLDMMNVAAYALGEAIGTGIVRAFDAATNAVTGFLSSGWEYAATIENAEAQLRVFLGSQEAANEALEIAQRRAARTPFAFEDYARSLGSISAIQRQQGGELEAYLDLVERLAASNPAEGFEGATFALREAFSGDFLSLQGRFNIPKATIAALKETGVTAETLSDALNGLGFSTDLVSGLADTLGGRISTLKDTFTVAAGAFMTPIFDAVSESIFGLQGTLDEKMPIIQERLASAGQYVADAITSFRQGFQGDWVDSEIIQPGHRVAGTLGIMVRNAVDNLTAAWSSWNLMVQKGKDLWNTPWLQEKIVQPLQALGSDILEGIVGDFSKLVSNWQSLNRAGDEWNLLMEAGAQMWQALVGAADALGIDLQAIADAFIPTNKGAGELHSWGGKLEIVLGAVTKLINFATIGINLATVGMYMFRAGIDVVIAGWRLLRDEMLAGLPDVTGILAGANPWVNAPGATGGGGAVSGPAATDPPKAIGNTGKGAVSVNVSVNVPPNTSPRVAAGYVTDGVTQALRSKGLA